LLPDPFDNSSDDPIEAEEAGADGLSWGSFGTTCTVHKYRKMQVPTSNGARVHSPRVLDCTVHEISTRYYCTIQAEVRRL